MNNENFFNKEIIKNLEESRKKIDEIDNKLIDLISQRTELARDIVLAKQSLNMEINDSSRENYIHDKTTKLARQNNLDEEILNQIMNMLMILSKNKQKEILRGEKDG